MPMLEMPERATFLGVANADVVFTAAIEFGVASAKVGLLGSGVAISAVPVANVPLTKEYVNIAGCFVSEIQYVPDQG